ncbi:uncharacterized protein LOC124594667 [Schistocerca americana]|uniref:uncharacterized protein LOC124594667 n=1 Tax=Schistocerca americana TaxID=7009 RepID=UPI001F503133|nr:uncharacterized protein LOC124594667 [Schistocerca americana]
MASYGFPMTLLDLRCVVKSYLDRTGRKVPVFGNGNFPGREWAMSFMKRHKYVLSERVTKNITYARAATDTEVIDSYFEHLEKALEGIPPEKIWNYDETNVQDDPGSKKVLVRRGAKYPERIQNCSKACTSIMVCGNAAGQLAPLYVNYKAENMWSTWTENGPEGARYNRTKSGWFDHQVFEDWFINLMLPILKQQDGQKVLIGDNLSSHINLEVIRLCEKYGIKFIALPPNATHLLQPLDVAIFRVLKLIWREILSDWKQSTSGSRCTSVPKDELPGLLKKMMDKLQENIIKNLQSGFRKTGIFPLNKMEVLQRLPKAVLEESLQSLSGVVGEIFIEELQKKREEVTGCRAPKRRRRLTVPAGRSIYSAEIEASRAEQPKGKNTKASTSSRPSGSKEKAVLAGEMSEESSSDEDNSRERNWMDEDPSDPDVLDESFSCLEDSEPEMSPTKVIPNDKDVLGIDSMAPEKNVFKVDDFVVVNFEGKLFPGRVTEEKQEGYIVSVMERTKMFWKWPTKEDAILYSKEEVFYTIDPPRPVGKRGFFEVKNLD